MGKSLQAQLVAAVLLAEVLLAGGLIVVWRYSLWQQLVAGLDSAVSGRAMAVAALVRYAEDGSGSLVFDKGVVPATLDPALPDAYEVFGPDGSLIARSDYWPHELGPGMNLPSGFWTVRAGGRHLRGIRLEHVPILDEESGVPLSASTLTVVYATPTRSMYERMESTTYIFGGAALLLVAITALFAFFVVRRSLMPLRKLASEAGGISAHQWSFEPPESASQLSELRPLVESLEVMLARLRQAFESQRDFISNAAHELKTPVAIQKSTLQLLLHREMSAKEYKRGVQQALSDTERMEDLLQRLLRLARAEQVATGREGQNEPAALSASCEMALARMQPFAESRGVVLQFVPNGEARVAADPDDLLAIWSNLLENAIRHTPQGRTVLLKVDASGGQDATVTVADQGCGIDSRHHARIFERFYRGDQSRARDTGGTGLGLAIVRTLVEAYGGSISVDSEVGRGAIFSVKLPLS